ncbi:MAG: caspase family protein [Hyphomonadaceae bacterium]|nr:caspase family protein [Hyphomonadaceae bacterium]
MRYFIAFILSLALSFAADAQTKRAFIVGVQNYDELTDLTKTLADAEGYADVFENELGFEVTLLRDPNFSDFLVALSDFEATIETGDEIVFVFSGHGWSDGARNFVAMSDAPLRSTEVVLERLTFDLNEAIINKFRAKDPSLVLAIVDACRDNPFDLGTKSVTKGLVPQQTIPGTLVVYAAGASQQALDRLDPEDPSPYSVFTRTLLPKLENAETPLMRAFDEARSETAALASQISHLQRPAIYSDISLDFCFARDCETVRGTAIPDAATQRELVLNAVHTRLSEFVYESEYSMPFTTDSLSILLDDDIDGDGYDDFFISVEHTDFCGSAGCQHQLITYSDGAYKEIFSNTGGSLTVLPTSQNGMRDLALGVGFTLDRVPIYELRRFDGDSYTTSAIVACQLLQSYCRLEDALIEGSYEDSDSMMAFYPSEASGTFTLLPQGTVIYESLDAAMNETEAGRVQESFDYFAGMDSSGQFALVHIWKGTYGIARVQPTAR